MLQLLTPQMVASIAVAAALDCCCCCWRMSSGTQMLLPCRFCGWHASVAAAAADDDDDDDAH
jgi:hypothetical protein